MLQLLTKPVNSGFIGTEYEEDGLTEEQGVLLTKYLIRNYLKF